MSHRVPTATGSIDASALGRTLMHEHLFVVDAEYVANTLSAADIEAILGEAATELNQAYDTGIETIVDATIHGVGRIVEWIAEVARRTRVNILVATGVFVSSELPRLFSMRGPGTLMGGPDPLTETFIRDLTVGIGRSGVRAAVLKCVTDRAGLTPAVKRAIRAVALAQLETGVPILTHTDAGSRQGLVQQRMLADCGVDLARVVIGHTDDTADPDYAEELLRNGSYIGLDRFGYSAPRSLDQRIDLLVTLCSNGWIDRIVISHDSASYSSWMDREVMARLAPECGLTLLTTKVIPRLRDRGFTSEDIDQMLIYNPRRLFEVSLRLPDRPADGAQRGFTTTHPGPDTS